MENEIRRAIRIASNDYSASPCSKHNFVAGAEWMYELLTQSHITAKLPVDPVIEAIKEICREDGIQWDILWEHYREREWVDLRNTMVLLYYEFTHDSPTDIVRAFENRRDRATFIHSLALARNLVDYDAGFRRNYNDYKDRLNEKLNKG